MVCDARVIACAVPEAGRTSVTPTETRVKAKMKSVTRRERGAAPGLAPVCVRDMCAPI